MSYWFWLAGFFGVVFLSSSLHCLCVCGEGGGLDCNQYGLRKWANNNHKMEWLEILRINNWNVSESLHVSVCTIFGSAKDVQSPVSIASHRIRCYCCSYSCGCGLYWCCWCCLNDYNQQFNFIERISYFLNGNFSSKTTKTVQRLAMVCVYVGGAFIWYMSLWAHTHIYMNGYVNTYI